MSKVSVIIPVYNVEKYLRKCLDSVINQTYKDLEIICINDGSTDNSLQILEKYSEKDERIKIINRQNGGLSAARNSGLDIAVGKYVYFVDSDDWIEPNTINELVNIIESYNVDVVIHEANNILNDSSFIGTNLDAQAWFDSYTKNNGIYDVPKEINRDICPVTWNKLYKVDIINKYYCRFPEGLVNEDELFLWTYMIHCKNFYYLNKKLYNYLRRSDSIMGTRDNSPKILDILEILSEIYKTVKKYKDINEYQEYLTQNYVNNINLLFQRMPKEYKREALNRIKEYYEKTNHDKSILKLYNEYKYKNKIVFNNFNGRGYGCNPKYIAEEIIRQDLPYELVWLVKDVDRVKDEFPKEIRLVEYNVENAIKEFASAKIWISNQRMPELYENGLFKKKEQFYIQTWHGSLGIKKCERSVENEKPWWCSWAKIDSKFIDCMISNSKFLTNLYSNDFYYNGEIFECGNPRNDIFFFQPYQKEDIRRKVCDKLSIPYDKKIILYAPTFRDSDYENKNFSIYQIDNIDNIISALKNKFNGDWVYAVRLHPNISDIYFSNMQSSEFINASLYTDMQEILVAADVLITDYSSCIYDFILTKKPAFIYAKDLELYNNSTELYYSLLETPFDISGNSDQLINCINNFNQSEYYKKVDDFINKMGCIDKGTASKSIVNIISNIIN